MYETLSKKILKLADKTNLTKTEQNYIVKWKEDYKFDDKIVIEAVNRAVKLKKYSAAYVNAILKNWHEKGIRTYKDIIDNDNSFFENNSQNIRLYSGKKKNFVLDTNVLIHDPYCIYKFEENNIYIPHAVFEELDGFKKEKNERGFNTRECMRELHKLRQMGNLTDGVRLNDEGGMLYTYVAEEADMSILPMGWKKDKMDNIILCSVSYLAKKIGNVIMVTNDCNMLFKADILKIPVEEYKNDRVVTDELYKGMGEVTIYSDKMIEDYKDNGVIEDAKSINGFEEFLNNEYVTIYNGQGSSLFGKMNEDGNVYKLNFQSIHPFGLKARNRGQRFFTESLYDPESVLVIGNGPAGTGKTLFSVAAGLDQVMEKDTRRYKKVLITRPNIMMDEDIGFLPGDEKAKIDPLLRGVYDNLEVLLGNDDDTPAMIQDKIAELFQRGFIVAESLNYFRGRSINNTFIIVDECQNASPSQIYSIVTRVGIGSKLVLLGDIRQIDNIRLDSYNCGLSYVINKMKGSPLTDIITFSDKDCVRSELVKEASERLKIR